MKKIAVQTYGIENKKPQFEKKALRYLKKNKINLLCLAGFMKILSKEFIKKRANEKITELGYNKSSQHFRYIENKANALDWFYHLTGGVTHTDFFAIRPTDYSKANEGEDFEYIW